jgi:hypothetical protein
MKFVVDSSVWIDFLNGKTDGRTEFLNNQLPTGFVLLGDLVQLEVLQGIRNDHQFKKVKNAFEEFILVQPELCTRIDKWWA